MAAVHLTARRLSCEDRGAAAAPVRDPGTSMPPPSPAASSPKKNVFLSWSGERSRGVAEALRDVLPEVFEDRVEVWLSERDVAPGDQWYRTIVDQSAAADAGLFVMTPENQAAPWVMFEAGAIASRLTTSRVYVFCVGLAKDALDPKHPLSYFQGVGSDQKGTLRLFQALNKQLGLGVAPKTLEKLVDSSWKQSLAKALDDAKAWQAPPPSGDSDVWSCLVPRLPLKASQNTQLKKKLREIRDEAYRLVTEELKVAGVRPREVRACVFVPDASKVQNGACELFIPDQFRDWDKPNDEKDAERHDQESRIRFWPHQGLAGCVFVQREPDVAAALTNDAPGAAGSTAWSRSYKLSDWQKSCIHPQLQWVVAFPLCHNVTEDTSESPGEAFGVLAVDGLRFSLTQPQLEALIGQLVFSVNDFASRLAEAKFDRIVYSVEAV
jgi:hypothetical protein